MRYNNCNDVKQLIRKLRLVTQSLFVIMQVKVKRRWKEYDENRVSIITPTYNRLIGLEQAIESVKAQTYKNWEHIIVADGFDYRVKSLINKQKDRRFKFKYTLKINYWGNYQRNYALKFVTGQYILFLDDDNIIYEDCLEKMINGFTSDKIGYVIGKIKDKDTYIDPKPKFKHKEIDLLNYMVRRRLVEDVGGQGRHYSADYHLIDKIRKISEGNYLNCVIGHHR